MNIYHVEKKSAADQSMHWFDQLMFHGEETLPFSDPDREDQRLPVKLWRNNFFIPKIFAPNAFFVAHRSLSTQLEAIGVEMIPVIFARVFNIEYLIGKAGWKKADFPSDWQIYMDYIDQIADLVASETESKGEYFEVISPRLKSLTPAPPILTAKIPNIYGKMEEVSFSESLLETHPITWSSGFVFSEKAFSICDKELDRRFFDVTKLSPT